MPIFPLSQRLTDSELLKTTCHLYQISLLKVLPLSLLCVAIIQYFRFGKAYLPLLLQPYHQQSAMFLLVMILPLLGAMILVFDKIAKDTSFTVLSIVKETAVRFLSLIGALISMALVPLVVLGICVVSYYAMMYYHVDPRVLFAWLIIAQLLTFMAFVSNLYAPWLILSDKLDANEAQDESQFLVKNNFLRTFTHGLFAVLVIVFLIQLPGLVEYYFAKMKLPMWGVEIAAGALLMIIGPWSLVFLLTNKYDLQVLKKDRKAPLNTATLKVPSAIPKKSDNVSF